jgi:hypothetical protein
MTKYNFTQYERNTTRREEADKIARETGGVVNSFISTDKNGKPVKVYSVTYRVLF